MLLARLWRSRCSEEHLGSSSRKCWQLLPGYWNCLLSKSDLFVDSGIAAINAVNALAGMYRPGTHIGNVQDFSAKPVCQAESCNAGPPDSSPDSPVTKKFIQNFGNFTTIWACRAKSSRVGRCRAAWHIAGHCPTGPSNFNAPTLPLWVLEPDLPDLYQYVGAICPACDSIDARILSTADVNDITCSSKGTDCHTLI
jgi:hypothetical protein